VKLVIGAWKVLVAIKDGLVLVAMLLFFVLMFAALSMGPKPAMVRDGALVLDLKGSVVEQPEEIDPVDQVSGGSRARQYRLRDVLRALDAAKDDSRVKALVLDLDHFNGGYPAAMSEIAAAIGRVRAGGKPVLAYATSYTDDAYLLAANASEIWVDPLGGALFTGPGGTRLYYKGLFDKIGVTAHIYRVGTYKSAVEPYFRNDMSPEARENYVELYGSILSQWREAIEKARPRAKIADFLTKPDQMMAAAGGDIARANLAAGIVDRLGDRVAFGKHVAELVGGDASKPAGYYNATKLTTFLAAHPAPTGGDAIGVLTIAGDIVDGKAKAGSAGGDTISKLLLDGLAQKNLKALVVRVDSPGGSALAAETIRRAILEAKARKLPVVVSMGSLAASGGYWVSTPGDVIFAEPNTITGSIGIFGVIPTFEKTLAKLGLGADGVTTTPLTAQPDVLRGTNEAVDHVIQSTIEAGYGRFTGLVAQSRHMTVAKVDSIGQGRVWIGGLAHQVGLVDRFGGIDDAIAEAARRAKLDPKSVHPVYLEKQPSTLSKLIASLLQNDDDNAAADAEGKDVFSRIAAGRRAIFAQAVGDARRLAFGSAVQVRCLECAGFGPAQASASDEALMRQLLLRARQ